MQRENKNPKFYSEWSTFKKAWMGLWYRPQTNSEEIIRLNEDFLVEFYKTNQEMMRKSTQETQANKNK